MPGRGLRALFQPKRLLPVVQDHGFHCRLLMAVRGSRPTGLRGRPKVTVWTCVHRAEEDHCRLKCANLRVCRIPEDRSMSWRSTNTSSNAIFPRLEPWNASSWPRPPPSRTRPWPSSVPASSGWESYVAADKTFCVYLAKDENIIHRHAEISGFPATKVTAVGKMIDPTTEKTSCPSSLTFAGRSGPSRRGFSCCACMRWGGAHQGPSTPHRRRFGGYRDAGWVHRIPRRG